MEEAVCLMCGAREMKVHSPAAPLCRGVGPPHAALAEDVEGVHVRQLVEFPLSGGGSVFVEIDDREGSGGYVRAGRPGDLAGRAEETFDAALGVVRTVATRLVGQVQEMGVALRPDEVEVQFGICFSAKVGAVIAATEGQAQVTVTLRWARPPDPGCLGRAACLGAEPDELPGGGAVGR